MHIQSAMPSAGMATTIADDGTRLSAPIFEISQERAKRMAWAEVERRARNEQ